MNFLRYTTKATHNHYVSSARQAFKPTITLSNIFASILL